MCGAEADRGAHGPWGGFCHARGIPWLIPLCTGKSFNVFLGFSNVSKIHLYMVILA